MPAIAIAGVFGLVGGWVLSKGTEDVAATVKWVVIGGGVYLVAKKTGVL